MTGRFDVLTQQLFQKNISECTVEELQNLADTHPYFAPAQYALLTKLKETGDANYETQYQKAILYHHEPLEFEQFINGESYAVDFIVKEKEEDFVLPAEVEKNEDILIEEEQQSILEEEQATREDPDEPGEPEIITGEIKQNFNNNTADENVTSGETEIKPLLIAENKEPEKDLLFEPYHTVDYFASQGIKLSQEEATKDKFGKQLKSFTEWLKTMKKLPAVEQVKALDAGTEKNVENLAAHSVEAEDVYTETMAEVWIRQGNKEKAMEIYNKLSLLNPSKRAYFAAKIDSLK